jgi:hypothetical protein
MNGTRQQIQYSLALEQADQGEAPVSGHHSVRRRITRHWPSPFLLPITQLPSVGVVKFSTEVSTRHRQGQAGDV